MNHVRADRWYKTGRTILYGRLEDEAPFQSVRRLVQYEDYTLRLMRDSGIPTAAPAGIVELTPEREYLLVTEFLDGAQEIGDAVVDDAVIDEGLALIRKLWDSGPRAPRHQAREPDGQGRPHLPHRHRVRAGATVAVATGGRPRQHDARPRGADGRRARVHAHALRYFTADEIAEAFAAARGIASPTQLRSAMKQDGRDLLAQFRALAPERRPISLQRWGVRRVVYALGLAPGRVLRRVRPSSGCSRRPSCRSTGTPTCGTGQPDDPHGPIGAVGDRRFRASPRSRPAGSSGSVHVRQDRRPGSGSTPIRAAIAPSKSRCCRPTTARSAARPKYRATRSGCAVSNGPSNSRPNLRSTRVLRLRRGLRHLPLRRSSGEASASLMFDVDTALDFQPRAELVDEVQRPHRPPPLRRRARPRAREDRDASSRRRVREVAAADRRRAS